MLYAFIKKNGASSIFNFQLLLRTFFRLQLWGEELFTQIGLFFFSQFWSIEREILVISLISSSSAEFEIKKNLLFLFFRGVNEA